MHAIQRHNDPCDNHDGAFDTRPTRTSGTFMTEVEISDGIVLNLAWDAVSCAIVTSHAYADGERELIMTQLFVSLEAFLRSFGPPDVAKKVKTAIRAALKAQKDG